MNILTKVIVALALILPTGCVSAAAKDATKAAIEQAEAQIRLRWAEEWKPALVAEVGNLTQQAKEEAVARATIELEQYKAKNEGKLESIGVKVEEFDLDKDGRVSGTESLALLKEIKAKNDQAPAPLEWWEILLAVGAAYVPLTGAKELARKTLKSTGSGSTTVTPPAA